MKKHFKSTFILVFAVTLFTACGRTSVSGQSDQQAVTPKGQKTTGQTAGTAITEEDAKSIALEHAQISEDDATFVKVNLETENGISEYEVEFYVQNTEYDYSIDAQTGDILSYDNDIEHQTPTVGTEQNTTQTDITLEEAKKIALNKVSGATESDIRIQQDTDDGRTTYEGKIIYNGMEYEFEIDAVAGTILEWDAESVYN